MQLKDMNLSQLQTLCSQRALEKGFDQTQLADPKVLEFPVSVGLLLVSLMGAVEDHRKGAGVNLSSAENEALANALAKFGTERDLDRLSPEKKYLITKLVLIASEASEAIEAVLETGSDNPKTSQSMVAEELADCLIRSIGLEQELRLAFPDRENSVAQATVEKIEYNAGRAPKHGGKLY